LQQAGVHGVVVFGNQNAHGSNLFKTVQATADEALSIVLDDRQKMHSIEMERPGQGAQGC